MPWTRPRGWIVLRRILLGPERDRGPDPSPAPQGEGGGTPPAPPGGGAGVCACGGGERGRCPLCHPPEPGPVLPGVPSGPAPPPKRFAAILGESGAGKTVYLNAAVAAAVHSGGRAVYIDAKGENPHMGEPVRSPAELVRYIARNARRRQWSVVLDAQGVTRAQMRPVWIALRKLGRVVVALDEADKWVHSGIGNEIQPESLRELIGWGRSRGVALLATARQPAEVHRDLRNSLSAAVSFSHSDQREAVKVARDWFGDAGLADHFRRLPPLHYLRVDRERGTITSGRVYPPGTPEGDRALRGG